MLRQEYLRKYLLGLLCSVEVPQDAMCNIGELWKNCDGELIDIHDSYTGQVDENAPAPYSEDESSASVVISVPTAQYKWLPTKLDEVTLSPEIIITAYANDGHLRQNILDKITERILYRLLSYAKITDTLDDTVYKSVMYWPKRNEVTFRTDDESDFSGTYTIRTIAFTLVTEPCISKGNCDDIDLCFDFSNVTKLDKG